MNKHELKSSTRSENLDKSLITMESHSRISDITTETEKSVVLEILESEPIQSMWECILTLETKLFFKIEMSYVDAHFQCWREAKTVLDIGCGNGCYTANLAESYPEKQFHGIEENPEHFKIATENHHLKNLTFECSDSHILNNNFIKKYDVVFMRLVLQHLTDSDKSLKNIYQYLKPNGRVMLIESADNLRQSPVDFPYIDDVFDKINSYLTRNKINRYASLELMKCIASKQSEHSKFFKIESSNISNDGVLDPESEKQLTLFIDRDNKDLFFSQKLTFFSIWKKHYNLDVDLGKVYDEYKAFVENENAHLYQGFHMLCLKKDNA